MATPWLYGWTKRMEITIDLSKIDGDLTNFPVMIHLTSTNASALFSNLVEAANRKKIAVTTANGTTQCKVEIQAWDHENSTAILHVKVPSVSGSAYTVMYLYYDSTQSDNTTNVGDTGDAAAQAVWESSFRGVWHLAEEPTGGAGCVTDSTSNANHGTPAGSMTSGDLVDAKVGKGLDLDGTNDYVGIADSATMDLSGNLAIIALVKTPTVSLDYQCILAKDSGGDGNYNFYVKTNQVHFQFYSLGWKVHTSTAANLVPDTWYLVAVVFDVVNNTIKLYKNDMEVYSGAQAADPVPNSAPAIIGFDYGAEYFSGVLDEVHLLGEAPPAAWIKATYHALFDTLLTFGVPETQTPTFVVTLQADGSLVATEITGSDVGLGDLVASGVGSILYLYSTIPGTL